MLANIEEHAADAGAHGGEPGGAGEIFSGLFGHLMPHDVLPGISNHILLMAIAGGLILWMFRAGHAARADLQAGGPPKGRFANFIESLVLFVRDDMVYDIMGKENGRRFAPLFLTQFFFIWVVNILGNMPLWKIGGAATANINVTAALACSTLVVMLAQGVKVSGPVKMWTGLVPHGVPGWMWPLMFVVELASFFIKPGALMIRLFANMMGGHLVILSLFGLIQMFQSWLVFGLVMPMALFVGVLELLVAFLQAFIFTFLSILFVQASVHPEH